MDDFKEQLRRLAVHDEALMRFLSGEGDAPDSSPLDAKIEALVQLGATIALDAATASFQHAVMRALAAGASSGEVVATLEAVTPVTGTARVVLCAPKVALALGYDVESALE